MISVVYFENGARNVMVAAFLRRSDAEQFIKNTFGTNGYKIKDIYDWESWSNIRGKI